MNWAWRLAATIFLGIVSLVAHADDPLYLGMAERTRAEANRFELMAADLLDEMVFGWKTALPLPVGARFTLVSVTPPAGFNANLTSFLENHFYHLILSNGLKMSASACPQCSVVTVHSDANRTVVGPQWLVKSETGAPLETDFLLALSYSIVGEKLMLKAQFFDSSPDQNLVFARVYVTQSGTPPLLRASPLKSASEARAEYVDILRERPQLHYPIRFVTKLYPVPAAAASLGMVTPPIIWAEGGVGTYISPKRNWDMELFVGGASYPEIFDGFALGVRVERLLGREQYSLTEPNIYFLTSVSYQELVGPGAVVFINPQRLTVQQALKPSRNLKVSLATVRLGLEFRLKNLLVGSAFLESLPTEEENQNLGKVFGYFHSYGFEFGFML